LGKKKKYRDLPQSGARRKNLKKRVLASTEKPTTALVVRCPWRVNRRKHSESGGGEPRYALTQALTTHWDSLTTCRASKCPSRTESFLGEGEALLYEGGPVGGKEIQFCGTNLFKMQEKDRGTGKKGPGVIVAACSGGREEA